MMKKREAVLVIEDQPNWREVLSSLLEDEYEVTSAGSYIEAVRAILKRKTPFALALIDIRLDDRDSQNEEGLKLFRKLRELSVPTSVIIVTGYPTIRTTKEALKELGALDYILKHPEDGSAFNLMDFRRTVRSAVEAFVKRREKPDMQRRALVVEDESNWENLLSSILTDSEYIVDVVAGPEEATEKIRTHRYDLTIVDLKLGESPPEKGMELLGEIRKFNKETEVIVVSAWDTSERVRDAFAKYRVQDFLMKSHFSQETFREAIKRAESARRARLLATLSN